MTEGTTDLAEDLRAHRGRCDACAEDFVLDLSVLSELLKRGDEILKHDEDGTLGTFTEMQFSS